MGNKMSESKYIHTMIKIKDKELTIIVPEGTEVERVIIESSKGWTVDGVDIFEPAAVKGGLRQS